MTQKTRLEVMPWVVVDYDARDYENPTVTPIPQADGTFAAGVVLSEFPTEQNAAIVSAAFAGVKN